MYGGYTYHENQKRYTHIQKKPTKGACLDMYLVSQNLANITDKADIAFAPFSDHNEISIELSFESYRRGPGVW